MNIETSHLDIHTKTPNEVLPIEVNFGKLHVLPRGATKIASATASAKRWKRKLFSGFEVDNTILISTTPAILLPNETTLRVIVVGGLDGYNYVISITATFDNGAILKEELYVKVIGGM
jgi:hypothetical protein